MTKPSTLAMFLPALLAAGCSIPQPLAPLAGVPQKLNPDPGESLAMIVPAKGVQIYECRPNKGQQARFEWAFVAPQAELFDTRGARIGRHYGGPHWEAADGSRIVGAVKERADAPVAGAIPWLLLSTKSVGPEGRFSTVTSIQRVNTAGGAAPASGCTQASAGKAARVPYTADYYFFATR